MNRKLVINWLVPEPFPGAGGDVSLFRLPRYLAEFGHRCRVYVVAYSLMNDFTTEDVRAYIKQHFGESDAVYYRFENEIEDADCTFATFWPTAEILQTLPNGGRKYYLVQDFEPTFYPGDDFHTGRAENTYRMGFHCITLGPWLARLLRERYGVTADYFDFAVDPKIYWPRPKSGDRKRICFYARPATPRRAYELGIAALAKVKSRLPEVKIVFFGTNELAPVSDFPMTNRGLITPEELAKLFSNSDVGLVLSLTNPSFVSFEMMACRCAVVEIASERFDAVLAHGEDAWLVEPAIDSIAEGIIHLLENDYLRDALIERAYERAREMDWRKSARQIESILLRNRS